MCGRPTRKATAQYVGQLVGPAWLLCFRSFEEQCWLHNKRFHNLDVSQGQIWIWPWFILGSFFPLKQVWPEIIYYSPITKINAWLSCFKLLFKVIIDHIRMTSDHIRMCLSGLVNIFRFMLLVSVKQSVFDGHPHKTRWVTSQECSCLSVTAEQTSCISIAEPVQQTRVTVFCCFYISVKGTLSHMYVRFCLNTHQFTQSGRQPPVTWWSWWRSSEQSGLRTPLCPKCLAWLMTPTTCTGWPLSSASTWVKVLLGPVLIKGVHPKFPIPIPLIFQ